MQAGRQAGKSIRILLKRKRVAQVAGHFLMEIHTFELKSYDLLQEVARVGRHMSKKGREYLNRVHAGRQAGWQEGRQKYLAGQPSTKNYSHLEP